MNWALRPLGDQDLASTVQSIKGSSAHAANRLLNRSGSRFWARDYFDRRIRDRDHEGPVIWYIENNPVKAGLCGSAPDWPWSSARKNAARSRMYPTPGPAYSLRSGFSCWPAFS